MERLKLLADGTYTREVLDPDDPRPCETAGRWTYERESIKLHDFAIAGLFYPRADRRVGKTPSIRIRLPVERRWWRIPLGDGVG